MSTIVLLSVLMLSVKPSVDLRDRFVDLSAFVPELLICRPSCRKCGGRPSCRPSSCRFWKPPHVEEVLPKFSTSLYNLDFYLFTHMQFIFFQRHSGASSNYVGGRRGRTSRHPQLEHRWDPSCREPPAILVFIYCTCELGIMCTFGYLVCM
jgi:hypothetical protein